MSLGRNSSVGNNEQNKIRKANKPKLPLCQGHCHEQDKLVVKGGATSLLAQPSAESTWGPWLLAFELSQAMASHC